MATPEIPSVQTIKERIQSDIESKINQTIPALPLSFVRVLSFAVAGPIFLLYVAIIWVFNQIFPETADYENLIKHGELVDVPIKEATFAELTADIFGTGLTVPAGTIFRGTNQVAYSVTVATAIVAGVADDTPIKSLESGTVGNLADGEALVLQGAVAGLDGTGTITGTTTIGADIQSRESYRDAVESRYKTKFIYGSPAGYAISGLEAPGFIWVGPYADPTLPGNTIIYGRVDLSLATDGVPTASELISLDTFCRFDPDTGLEVRRPINDTIVATAISNREFEITISINGANPTMKTEIEDAVFDHLQSLEPYIEGVSLSRDDTLTNTDVAAVADNIATQDGAKVILVSIEDILTASIVSSYVLFGGTFAILKRPIIFIDIA